MAPLAPSPSPYLARPRRRARSREFCLRCHLFQITDAQALTLPLAALQDLVKHRYRLLVQRYHPDHNAQRKKGFLATGHRLQRLIKNYTWIMAQTEETLDRQTHTVQEFDAPWAWDRHPVQYSDAQVYTGVG